MTIHAFGPDNDRLQLMIVVICYRSYSHQFMLAHMSSLTCSEFKTWQNTFTDSIQHITITTNDRCNLLQKTFSSVYVGSYMSSLTTLEFNTGQNTFMDSIQHIRIATNDRSNLLQKPESPEEKGAFQQWRFLDRWYSYFLW